MGGKRIYFAFELAPQIEKSGGRGLRVFLVDIKVIIGRGELGGGVVNAVFGGLWRPCGAGRGPGLYPPEVWRVNFP